MAQRRIAINIKQPFKKPFTSGGYQGSRPSGGAGAGAGAGAGNKFQRGPKKNENDPFNINEEIRAREVRVIGPDGKMLGVYPTQQAQQLARDFGLDLIEVAPEAAPPTCKIMDYGKWKYENKKKTQANKKKQIIISLKEIQVRLRTDDHDLEVKLRHARRFLLEGDKVKFSLRFQGREMSQMDMGRKMMAKLAASLGDLALIESEPKSEGRQMFMIVAPDALKIKDYKIKHPKGNKKDVASEDEPELEKEKESD